MVNKTPTYVELDNIDFLQSLTQLEELQLENFNICPTAHVHLLSNLRNLQVLDVPLSDATVNVVMSLEKLRAIHLYSLTPLTLDCLSKLPNLVTVDISPCGPEITRDNMVALSKLKHLTTLYLDNHHFLEDEHLQLLLPMLSRTAAVKIIPKQYQMPPSRSWLSPIAPRGPYTGGVGPQVHDWSFNSPVMGH